MKDETKMRVGIPKYARTWGGLFALGFGLFCFARYVGTSASNWILQLGGVSLAAAMTVLVAGLIAERREWKRQHQKPDENHSHGSNLH